MARERVRHGPGICRQDKGRSPCRNRALDTKRKVHRDPHQRPRPVDGHDCGRVSSGPPSETLFLFFAFFTSPAPVPAPDHRQYSILCAHTHPPSISRSYHRHKIHAHDSRCTGKRISDGSWFVHRDSVWHRPRRGMQRRSWS